MRITSKHKLLLILFLLLRTFHHLKGAVGSDFDPLFVKAGQLYQFDARVIKAICIIESNLDPKAVNKHDGGPNNHAIGLCQILIRTAVEVGTPKDLPLIEKCKQLNKNCFLYDPDINIKYASIYFKHQLIRYNNHVRDAIAAYNAGMVRRDEKGRYRNQRYVDLVMKTYQKLVAEEMLTKLNKGKGGSR